MNNWKTWGDVPDEVKAQLLQGPFAVGGEGISSGMPLYTAIAEIAARGGQNDPDTEAAWKASAEIALLSKSQDGDKK